MAIIACFLFFQILTTHAWLQMKWSDSRLKWNPEDFDNVKMMRIEAGSVWIPDIVPYNGEQQRASFVTIKDDIPAVIFTFISFTGQFIAYQNFCRSQH